jgi:hypothetical protein
MRSLIKNTPPSNKVYNLKFSFYIYSFPSFPRTNLVTFQLLERKESS